MADGFFDITEELSESASSPASPTQGGWFDWIFRFQSVPAPVPAETIPNILIPSQEQSVQLSILVFEPLVTGSPLVTDQLGFQLDSYQQTMTAVGGYEKATITVKDRQLNIEDWLDRGVGRHIEVYNPSLVKIWEGFINKISINLGGLSVTRGPLMEVGNKVAVAYSTMDTSVNPPAVGARVTTTFAEDTTSQSRYGEFTTVLTTGGATQTTAETIRDTWLAENKEPKTSQTLTVGGSGDISMTLECAGYYNFLKKYTYDQVSLSGTGDLDDILISVLASEPNGIISANTTNITENTLQTKQFVNENATAWKLIQGLVARGDTSDNRYIFQILNDRIATYAAVPTTVAYQQRLNDPAQRVETLSGIEVKPWDVKAGQWMFIPDFLIGKIQPTDLRLDPRMIFIESVLYTMPWGLTVQGGTIDKLSKN